MRTVDGHESQKFIINRTNRTDSQHWMPRNGICGEILLHGIFQLGFGFGRNSQTSSFYLSIDHQNQWLKISKQFHQKKTISASSHCQNRRTKMEGAKRRTHKKNTLLSTRERWKKNLLRFSCNGKNGQRKPFDAHSIWMQILEKNSNEWHFYERNRLSVTESHFYLRRVQFVWFSLDSPVYSSSLASGGDKTHEKDTFNDEIGSEKKSNFTKLNGTRHDNQCEQKIDLEKWSD